MTVRTMSRGCDDGGWNKRGEMRSGRARRICRGTMGKDNRNLSRGGDGAFTGGHGGRSAGAKKGWNVTSGRDRRRERA